MATNETAELEPDKVIVKFTDREIRLISGSLFRGGQSTAACSPATGSPRMGPRRPPHLPSAQTRAGRKAAGQVPATDAGRGAQPPAVVDPIRRPRREGQVRGNSTRWGAGERVMALVSRFLTTKLRLKVNVAKSAVARPEKRKFLGFSIANDGSERGIAPKAQGADPGQDPPDTGDQLDAVDRRPHAIPHRMARILWLLLDPTGARQPGCMDPPKATFVSLAAMAKRPQPLPRTATARRAEVPGGGCRRFADRVLAHVRTSGGPTGPAQPVFRRPRSSPPLRPCSGLTRSNRRGTDPYARWWGRGGVARRPPIPIPAPFRPLAEIARIGTGARKQTFASEF